MYPVSDIESGRVEGGGGGVATMTAGALKVVGLCRCMYDDGGEDVIEDVGERNPLTDSAVLARPFNFSPEPPSASLDIIRCNLPPERLLEDSSEIILALRLGICISIGGPSSRKSMRSRAVFDMCGLEGSRREEGVGGIVSVSSSSIPITSSRSKLSRFLAILRVRVGRPSGVGGRVDMDSPRLSGCILDECVSVGIGGRILLCDAFFWRG